VFNLGMGEITVILLLALIFIGPAKLPDLASGLGKLIREFRKVTSDIKKEITLHESIRKPFEELRDAVTLHPDELKRRDQIKKSLEELAAAQKRTEAEAAAQATEAAAVIVAETAPPVETATATPPLPPVAPKI
jgi:TatA/E family protein of Tat protein translocase